MAIAADIENKIQRLIQLATKELRLEAVYLFGSTVGGEAHEWSDIDLAIISPDFVGDTFEDNKRFFPYILQIDTGIEVHTFRPGDFSINNPFVAEIIDTGIRIH